MGVLLHISSSRSQVEDEKLTIAQAFQLLEVQDTFEVMDDNFIGFMIEGMQQVVIQFSRHTTDIWYVDIPVFKNDKFQKALNGRVDHHQVFRMVKDFFDVNSNLYNLMVAQDYKKIGKLFLNNYLTSLK